MNLLKNDDANVLPASCRQNEGRSLSKVNGLPARCRQHEARRIGRIK